MNRKILSVLLIVFVFANTLAYAVPPDLWDGDDRVEALFSDADSVAPKNDILQKLLIDIGVLKIRDDVFDPAAKANARDFEYSIGIISGVYTDGIDADELSKRLHTGNLTSNNMANGSFTFDDMIYSGLMLTGYPEFNNSTLAMTKVAEIGLLNNIKYSKSAKITNAELAQFLYNILSVPSKKVLEVKDGYLHYEKAQDSTLLERQFDIVMKKGVATSVCGMHIYNDTNAKDGQIEIDRVAYNIESTEGLTDLLGRYVVFFSKENDDLDTGIIKAIDILQSKNSETTFLGSDIQTVNDNKIKLCNEEDTISISADSNACIVYNGAFDGNYTVEKMMEFLQNSAEITAIDNNKDDIIDVFLVWEYRHYPVAYDVGTLGTAKFKYDMAYNGLSYIKLIADSNNDIIEIIKNGNKAEPTEIKKNDIVSIAKSRNSIGKTLTFVIVGSKKVTGEITEIYEEGNTAKYKINDEIYTLSSELDAICEEDILNKDILKPYVGLTGSFILSENGLISDISGEGETVYGYLISLAVKKGVAGDAEVKILTVSSNIEIFKLSKKVTLYSNANTNGESLSNLEAVNKIIAENSTDPRSVIKYKLDGAGEITEFYLPIDNIGKFPGTTDYPLTIDYYVDNNIPQSVRYYMGLISTKYRCKNTIPVFFVPTLELADNDKAYAVQKIDARGKDYYYDGITLYGVDKFYFAEAAVIVGGSGIIDPEAVPVVVDKVTRTCDEEGEYVKIYFWQEGKYKSIETEDLEVKSEGEIGWYDGVYAKDLLLGDVFQFTVSPLGKMSDFRLLFRPSDPKNYRYQIKDGSISLTRTKEISLGLWYASVIGVKDDMILVDMNEDENITSPIAHLIYETVNCYLLDENEKKISVISISDIQEEDKIILHERWARMFDIIVYRQ